MMRELIDLISRLVAYGIPTRDLVTILEQNAEKAAAMRPVLVAFRLDQGEAVNVPREILEVARDIQSRFQELRQERLISSEESISVA